MDRSARTTFSSFIAILAIFVFILPLTSSATSVTHCSSQNTGSDNAAQRSTYQSHGFCNDHCKDSHPFGVILGENCWCSDYFPADQEDTSECSDECQGFPDEKCGNEDKNLYIYIRLDSNAEIKGTRGSSMPTSSSSPSQAPATSTLRTTTTAPSSSEALIDTPPVTSVQIVTVSGVIVTQTVVTPYTSAPALTGQSKNSTPIGAIVGGVIGGLAVLGAIVGAIIFVLFRRRRQRQEDQSGVQRNTSTMSKSGLLGRGEKQPQHPPKIATTFNSRHSRTLDNESISPISGSDRRNSRLVFDQRLNPTAIMVLDNPSRDSLASMDDSRDYGRTLNVRNPDPDNR